MTNLQLLLIGAGIIIGVVGSLGFEFPYLKKKGVDAKKILDTAEQGLEDVGTAIKVGQQISPSKELNMAAIFDYVALTGVKEAQQLFISSQLPLEQRKQASKESILNGLKVFKVPITPEVEKFVDSVIQRTVFDTKTPEEQKAQQQNTLQQQVTVLQSQLAQSNTTIATLNNDKAALQQKINSIQSTVGQTTAIDAVTTQQAQ